jgi:subtilisin-like proprotein convertase family protein
VYTQKVNNYRIGQLNFSIFVINLNHTETITQMIARNLLFSMVLILTAASQSTLTAQSLWTPMNGDNIEEYQYGERQITPTKYVVSLLDEDRLKKHLNKSPLDNRHNKEESGSISLPMPDGSMEDFKVWYSPVMHPNLAAKFPDIKTFRVVGKDNGSIYGRVGISKDGFHASLKHPEGEVYIDTYADETSEVYISYYTKDQETPDYVIESSCGTDFDPAALADVVEHTDQGYRAGEAVFLKKYRLAIATTGEWGDNFASTEAVMAQIVIGANRVNQTFENEASVFFELVENNDELIFRDPNSDPYIINANTGEGIHPGRQVLGQNTDVLNSIIGADAYDLGHCFTRSCTDGIAGVAALGSVCTGNKGAGISCIGGSNVSSFMVGTTIHELGHQFGASHTWQNCSEASNDQFAAGTGYEPGSGTTHMSYAGTCGGNNLAGTNDDYFHVGSLIQMYSFVEGGNGSQCGEDLITSNTTPDITIPIEQDLFIPIFTPFELNAIAVDDENDALTYCWEQFNLGPQSSLGNPIGNAPSFRSFPPREASHRVFPAMSKVINNVSDNSERLQIDARDYSFMVTVRDNHPGSGIAEWTNIEFESASNAGPFFVTAPNSNDDLEVGLPYEIQWDVAGTDVAPVNCEMVDIFLSEDGGDNFDIVLARNTPNDGSHSVIVPNNITDDGRIRINGVDNIFFDVSNFDFNINAPTVPSFFMDISDQVFDLCTPEVVTVDITMASFLDFGNDVSLEVTSDLPEGSVVTLSENAISPDQGSAVLTLDFNNINATGNYLVTITGTAEGADVRTQEIQVELTSTNFDDLALVGPGTASSGISEVPTFEWSDAINAVTYSLEVSDNPAFGANSIINETGLTDNSYIPQVTLEKNTVYYWRVSGNNKCTAAQTTLGMFATEALSCKTINTIDLPFNISASGMPQVTSTAFVSGSGQVSDVNVQNVDVSHDNTGELRLTLTSPSGTEVVLVDEQCGFTRDINCGFDGSAAIEITCPISDNNIYQPEGDLSTFNGEPIVGDWIMTVADTRSGNGGQFREFALEVCSNEVLEGPSIVNNNALEVPTDGANRLTMENLLTQDANNTAEEISYTLLSLPVSGTMTVSGAAAAIGTIFTQQDIEDGRIRYAHNGNAVTEDSYTYTVNDGEGGWIPTTESTITIGEGFVSSTEDDLAYFAVNVYPNPAHDYLTVEINTEVRGDYQVSLFDLTGKMLLTEQFNIDDKLIRHIEATTLPSGMILVKIQNGTENIIKMTSIQH